MSNSEHDADTAGSAVPDGGTPTVVVVGDSVAWGQGLVHGRKYASRFLARLDADATLDRAAIKAHSGAVVGKSGASAGRDVTLTLADADGLGATTRGGRHEFPAGPFTVHTQVDRLPDDYTDRRRPESVGTARAYDPDETVDVVLVTAGINDIGGGKIANPLGDPESTEQAVRRSCYSRMRQLLRRLTERFPDAVVVVTGYHLFLSTGPDGSDVVSMDALAAGLQVLFGLYDLSTAGILGALYGTAELAEELAAARVEYFYQQSTHYLRRAVTEVDKARPGPSVLFASPDFDRENAADAADPWVWSPGSRGDPRVATERVDVCEAMAAPSIGDVSVKCPVAPSLHPNAAGAEAMARSIHERYTEATDRRSLRSVVGKLSAADDGPGPTSVRESLERYAGVDDLLDPAEGLRTCFDQLVVDSVRVVIETSDDANAGNQAASVSLSLGGLSWDLDDTFGQQGFAHANFSTGATDDFAIDPLFENSRTERDPLHLWEVSEVVLEQHQESVVELFNSQWWKVASFELSLNGVRVIDSGSFVLDGTDSRSFDYPSG